MIGGPQKPMEYLMCPSGAHPMRSDQPTTINYQHNNYLDSLLTSQTVVRSSIFKKEIKIGMLSEKMITEYFSYYYFPQFEFYDTSNKVKSFRLNNDLNSYLR